jgi:hypothetical protein
MSLKSRLKTLRRRLLPGRLVPKEITRIRAKSGPFVPASRPYETSAAGQILIAQLERNRARYEELCAEIVGDRDHFAGLSYREPSPDQPHWRNHYLPPLDGMILYTLIRKLRPATYLEIGSGNSTKFVRKAIRDHGLSTRIISIDPSPRAEIDALCDEVIRQPFQNIAAEALSRIAPGDIVFQDSSHQVFTNTDTTVFFTEFLPMLPRGVVYGIHDIFLPRDYPPRWFRRFFNEQYLFLTYLLAGAAGDEILFPVAYVAQDERLSSALDGIFDLPALAGARPGGGAFWMRRP